MDELLTALQIALLTTAVIGATEAVRRAFKQDWEAVVIIIISAVLGGFGAAFLAGWSALIFFYGLSIGLGASGIITTVQKFGQGTPTTLR